MKLIYRLRTWFSLRHQRRRERAVAALRHYRIAVAALYRRSGRLPSLKWEAKALRRIFRALR